jgi:hypothetical protein
MGDLVKEATVKQAMRVGVSTDDKLIGLLIPACSQFIRNYLSHDVPVAVKNVNDVLEYPVFSEYYDGKNNRVIPLYNTPIKVVQSVFIGKTNIPAALTPQDTGFFFSTDRLFVNGWVFATGYQNVKTIYQAGYEAVPADIEQACREMVLEKYKRMTDRIGQRSASIMGQNITFNMSDLTDNVKDLLSPYKRVFLGASPG